MSENNAPSDKLVWLDLEMTGLDPDRDRILEIAMVVTDNDLNVLAEAPVIAVHQSDEVLAAMDDWNQKTHGASGLIERVRASRIDEAQAEAMLRQFLAEVPVHGTVLLDRNQTVLKTWGAQALPATFLLDAAGRPRLWAQGERDWQQPDLAAQIQQIFK